MGMIGRILSVLFGGQRNVIVETAQVFHENAENAGLRAHDRHLAALSQLATEFALPRRGWFDRALDGINRLPRPAMALGTLALIGSAMADPVWFASRMQGLSLVPEPLWWLLGAIVSFYFGSRAQAKGQEFQRSVAATLARAPQVVDNIAALESLRATSASPPERVQPPNPALAEWRASAGNAKS